MLFAGTDTTSTVLTTILSLLAKREDLQDKLRDELIEARRYYGEEVPYDELSALPLLDAIIRETLRV